MEDLIRVIAGYQYFAAIAFIATVFFTPLAIRAAHHFGVLDIPDQNLKPHARPIPYLGGTAICIAWGLALLAAMLTGTCRWGLLLPILLGGLAMSTLGLVDDVRGVTPKKRLLIGAVVIGTVLATTGIGFHLGESAISGLTSLVAAFGLHLPGWLVRVLAVIAAPASFLVGILLVLGACNSANLIDGLDGLCSGVTAIISLGFFLLATHLAVWQFSAEGDPVRLVLAIAMFGAALGFLPWNFNPAKIFMGDAGSVLLGYNCGMLILLFAERSGILRWVVGALMIFALPAFDTALAMFRRLRSQRSILEGDRSHFYDQLVRRGWTVRQTVLICYALTLAYTAVGLLVTWVQPSPESNIPGVPAFRTRHAILLYLGVCLVTAFVAWRLGLTTPDDRRDNGRQPQEPQKRG